MVKVLLVLVVLGALSDVLAAAIGIIAISRMRTITPLARCLRLLFWGWIVCQGIYIFSDGMVKCASSRGPWSIAALVVGRYCFTFSIWLVVLNIVFGIWNDAEIE